MNNIIKNLEILADILESDIPTKSMTASVAHDIDAIVAELKRYDIYLGFEIHKHHSTNEQARSITGLHKLYEAGWSFGSVKNSMFSKIDDKIPKSD